jgi:hypothetical protein
MKIFFLITSIFLFVFTSQGWTLPSCKTDKLNNCEALATFSNGIVYYGDWKNNKKHGFGTVLTKTFSLSGEWIYNQFGNEGLMHFIDTGNIYIGEFKNNIINGKGIFILANGQKQEGVWKNEKFVSAMKINKNYKLPILNQIKISSKRFDKDKNLFILDVHQFSKIALLKKTIKPLPPITEEDDDDDFK